MQIRLDQVFPLWTAARLIQIVNAQVECAARRMGHIMSKAGRIRMTQMQRPRR